MKTLESLRITDNTPSTSSSKERFVSVAASYSSGWSSSSTSSGNLDSTLGVERQNSQLFEKPSKPSVQRDTVVFVYTDIASAERLWAVDPTAMAIATELHNHVLRLALAKYSVTSGSI